MGSSLNRIGSVEQAAREIGADARIIRRAGYDHSYFFIASFIDEQLTFLRDEFDRVVDS